MRILFGSRDRVGIRGKKIGSGELIRLQYLPPPADLAAFVSAYYLFETDEALFEDLERADIGQFRVVLAGEGEIIFGDGHRQSFFPVTLMGPRTKASRIVVRGPARVFGGGLLPAGWGATTGLPADKYANRLIDATVVLGDVLTETAAKMAAMERLEDMAALMTARAARFADALDKVPHWFIREVDLWLEASLSPDLKDLEAATRLSRRQIERLTRQIYGSPPKQLVRKYRALRTANRIARGEGDWQDFIDEGFYDQSHCIRELKEFVGITPSAIRDHVSRLTTRTFDRADLKGQISSLSAQT